ncbi:MAG: hypothetical protein ACRDBP_06660 [Luteolibacter sp.]
MKPTIEQIGDLLALKRDERPEDGYWQDFLCEFHHNQRKQAVKVSGFVGVTSRISEWFSEMSPTKWAYGAGLAYAAVTAAFFLMPRDVVQENMPAAPVNYQVVPSPPPVEQLHELDLSPTTQGNIGEQVF